MASPDEGLPLRQMKLKILYTFDTSAKNNCLARPPGVIDVHTATLDDGDEIGVVDLKICASALAQASPELVGTGNNDYTMYAYDYSEPDTPLAGQGMLSWALASPPSSLDSGQTSKMVTGRVTRNVLSLFSRHSSETLEVKLRLTPVQGKTQGEYLESLRTYQAMSNIIGQDFDAQAWTSFVQANPGLLAPGATSSRNQRGGSASPADRSDLENVQRLLSGETNNGHSHSRPDSRSGTPLLSQPFAPVDRRISSHSRPSSRTSMRDVGASAPLQNSHQRRASFNGGYSSGDEAFEEGPAKKRARLVQPTWHGTPEFNIERQPDSLRVAASTAASVRLHRPTPINAAIISQEGIEINNEEPVRPPTPVPIGGRAPMRRAATVSSGLRRESIMRSSSPQVPPSGPISEYVSAESAHSPDAHTNISSYSTPATANIPSSPPVLMGQQSNMSSPVLPPMHKADDSGFMSGNFDDFLNDETLINFDEGNGHVSQMDFENFETGQPFLENGPGRTSQDEQQGQHAATQSQVTANVAIQQPPAHADNPALVQMETASLPRSQELAQPQASQAPSKKHVPIAPAIRPASRAGVHSPRLAPAPAPVTRQGLEEPKLPQLRPNVPHSDPAGPSLQRSRTWAGDMSDIPGSDAGLSAELMAKERKRKLGKVQTHARLEAAVKTGQVPPFCENCGTIDTPAWRKAWSKMFGGGYELMECSGKDGHFVCKEILEQDDKGYVKLFRAYKLQKAPGDKDDEFASVNLCNSCGLWLQKNKSMRPESRWNKKAKDPNEKRRRPDRPRYQRNASKRGKGGDGARSDAPTEPASSPPDEGSGGDEGDESGEGSGSSKGEQSRENSEPQLPPNEPRTRSRSDGASPGSRESRKGLSQNSLTQRAVLSSPLRHSGSDHNDPIQIDLTPKPLRRQLFSSPTRPSGPAVLSEVSPNIVRRSPRLNKTHNVLTSAAKLPSPKGASIASQNKTPLRKNHTVDDLDDLFNASDNEDASFVQPPQTPTPIRRSGRLLAKTPDQSSHTPLDEKIDPQLLTPSQQRLLNILRTPQVQAHVAQHPKVATLLDDAANNAANEMTPFTRQIQAFLEANDSGVPSSSPVPSKRTSHKLPTFDFPDLPSLKGSSPNKENQIHVDFSEFTHLNSDGIPENGAYAGLDLQDLISTDIPMPSSPPILMDGWAGWPEKDQQEASSDSQQQRRVSPRRKKQTQVEQVDSGIGLMDMSEMDMDDGHLDRLIDQAFSSSG